MKGGRRAGALRNYFDLSSGVEFAVAATLFLLQVFFKIWNVFHYRFDSDESQHVHVIWGWTHGLVQYRDVFDNHMPLFHLLCAPLFGLFGERAVVLYWMRVLMVPLYFLSLWSLYKIGAVAFSRRVGVWAALFVGGIASFQFCSTEFRPDDLWTPLWLLALLVLVRGPLTLRTFVTSGLLLGFCYAISMKTTLMFLAIAAGFIITVPFIGWRRLDLAPQKLATYTAAFLGCMAIVPSIIILFFAGKGLWPQFSYCVFQHNLFLRTVNRNAYLNPLLMLPGIPLLLIGARKIIRAQGNRIIAFRHAFLFVACGAYLLILKSFWRHLTREDFLPFYSLLALLAVAGLFALARRLSDRFGKLDSLGGLPAIAAICVTLFDLAPRLPVERDSEKEVRLVRAVLDLTGPADYVFDCKGETVFRPRCFYYAFERLTLDRIEGGLLHDDAPRQMVERRACVAVINGELPTADSEFIEANYLSVGNGVRVAGFRLRPSPNESFRFHITIPTDYAVVTANGVASGLLDGLPNSGARFLEAGEHEFHALTSADSFAIIWARAAERHFTPFRPTGIAQDQLHFRPRRRLLGKLADVLGLKR